MRRGAGEDEMKWGLDFLTMTTTIYYILYLIVFCSVTLPCCFNCLLFIPSVREGFPPLKMAEHTILNSGQMRSIAGY